MNFLKLVCTTLIICFSFSNITAQEVPVKPEEDKLSLNKGTIDNQFEFVFKRSNSWQDFKVIKKNWFYQLKAHTNDTIKSLKNQLANTKQTISKQANEINSLKSNLSNTQSTLDQTNIEKDNMSLFGIQMSKGGYNSLMWSIIAGLLALLLFFIFKFKNSNAVTKLAKKNLSEIELEFEEHRRTALEREQKVRRQLQDEINKHRNS